MSKEVDEKVVSLDLDNSKFKKNADETVGILDRISSLLDKFGEKKDGFEQVAESVSKETNPALEDLKKTVEGIGDKFSSASVIAISALSNITNKVINTGEQLVKSLSIDQVTAGYSKYEEKVAATQTIMAATGKDIDYVSNQLKKLNWFTDETSYNFTDMANNIGKFTSAGVDLDTSVIAMEGIANATALAGQNAETASRVMFNFSQSLALGKVMSQDWNSVAQANVATKEFKETVIDTAVELGALVKVGDRVQTVGKGTEVTFENLGSTLSEGWFTSDVLIAALQKYGDYTEEVYKVATTEGISCAEAMEKVSDETMELGARAFRAGQEAKTFTDAINATKDAVSTGWMTTFEKLFGNYEEATVTFTEMSARLWELFASGGETRNQLLGDAMNSSVEKLKDRLDAVDISFDDFEKKFKEVAEESGVDMDNILGKWDSFSDALANDKSLQMFAKKLIPKTLRSFTEEITVSSDSVDDLNKKVSEYNDLVKRIAINGEFGNGEERRKELEALGYEYEFVQNAVNKFVYSNGEAVLTINDFSDAQLENMGYTSEQIEQLRELAKEAETSGSELSDLIDNLTRPSGRELFIDSIWNSLDALQQMIDLVKEAWSNVFPPVTGETLYSLVEKIHEFTENLSLSEDRANKLRTGLEGIFSVLKIFSQAVSSVAKFIKDLAFDVFNLDDAFFNAVEAIGKFLKQLSEDISNNNFTRTLDNIKQTISDFVKLISDRGLTSENIFDFLSDRTINLRENLSSISNFFKNSIKKISDWRSELSKSTDWVGALIDKIKNFLSIGNTVAIAVSGAIVVFVSSLAKGIDKIKGSFTTLRGYFRDLGSSINDLVFSLEKTFTSVTRLFNNFTASIQIKSFKDIATSILILSAAMLVLSTIDTEGMANAITSITVLFTELTAFTSKLSKATGSFKDLINVSVAMREMAISIVLLTIPLKSLAKLSWNELATGLTGVLVLIKAVSSFAKDLSRFGIDNDDAKGIRNVSKSLITLSIAVGILSLSVTKLGSLDYSSLFKGIISVGLLLEFFLMFSNEIQGPFSKLSEDENVAAYNKFSKSLITLSIAVGILSLSVTKLGSLDYSSLFKGIISVGLLLEYLILFVKEIDDKSITEVSKSIISVSVGLGIMSMSVKSLGSLDLGSLIKGVLGIWGLLVGIASFSNVLDPDNVKQVSLSLVVFSTAISLMTGSILLLSSISFGEMITALGAMAGSLLILIGVLYLFDKINFDQDKIKEIVSALGKLALVVLVLSASITALSGIGVEGMLVSLGTLIGMFGILIGFLAILSAGASVFTVATVILNNLGNSLLKLSGSVAIFSASLTLVSLAIATMVVALALIPQSMENMANQSEGTIRGFSDKVLLIIEEILKGILGLVPLIVDVVLETLLETMDALIDNIGPITEKVIELVVAILEGINNQIDTLLGAVFDLIATLIGSLAENLIDFLGKENAIENLATAVLGILGFLVAANIANALAPGAAAGVALTAAIIAETAVLIAAIGALGEIPGFEDLVKGGGDFLEVIGNAIGQFIGGIANGALSAGTANLGEVGQNLSDFATNASTFFTTLEDIDIESVAKLASIADSLDSIKDFKMKPDKLEEFSEGLSGFATALKNYAVEVSTLTPEQTAAIANSVDAAQHLTTLIDQIPNYGGVSGFFAGDNTWTNFADGLPEFGRALKDYSDAVKGIDVNAITLSSGAGIAMTNLLDAVPNFGGVAGWFAGDNTWTNLADGLADYGKALKDYGDSVEGLNVAAITASAGAGVALTTVLDEIPEKTAWQQWKDKVFGDDDTTAWSGLTDGLDDYAEMLKSVGGTAQTLTETGQIDSIDKMADVSQKLADLLNSLPEVKKDETVWDKFSNGLDTYGSALMTLSETTSDLNLVDINRVKTASEKLSDAISGFVGKETIVENLGANFESLGGGLSSFDKKINKLDFTTDGDIYRSIDVISKFSTEFSKLTAGATITEFCDTIDEYGTTLKDFYDKTRDIDRSEYVISGEEIVNGIIEGLNNKRGDLLSGVTSMANSIIETFNSRLGIHSPSDETTDSGINYDLGFAGGVEAGKAKIMDALGGVTNDILDTLGVDTKKLTDAFGNTGLNITSILGDTIGDFNIDSYLTDMTSMEGTLADLETQMNSAKETFGESSDEYKNAAAAYKEYSSEFKDFASNNKDALSSWNTQQLTEAKQEYDNFFTDYKNNRISQSEYDKRYVDLLKKYQYQAVDIVEYSNDQMSDYISDGVDKIKDKFESTMESIADSRKSVEENVGKSYEDAFTIKTNKDIYDEKVKSYEDNLSKLNYQLEQTKKLHGENSVQAKNYQKQIDETNAELEAYKSYYEGAGFDDEQIVQVSFNDIFKENTKELNEYSDNIRKLQKKNVSQELIDYLSTLDLKTGEAVVKYLNTLSTEELDKEQQALLDNIAAQKDVSAALYENQIETARTTFDTEMKEFMDSIPDTGKQLVVNIFAGMTEGFSEETENMLSLIGTTGESMIQKWKDVFDINSPSEVTKKEIGYNLADGAINGTIERLSSRAEETSKTVRDLLLKVFGMGSGEETEEPVIVRKFSSIIDSIKSKLSEINSPTITPVLDLSQVQTQAQQLNSMFSSGMAYSVANSMGYNGPTSFTDGTNPNLPGTNNGIIINQNNYSPEALDAYEVYRQTKNAALLTRNIGWR